MTMDRTMPHVLVGLALVLLVVACNGTDVPVRAVLSVSIDQTAVSLAEGETTTLTVTVEVTGGASQAVTWSSNDTTVATVAGGVVDAREAGVATIRATSVEDGTKTDAVTVSVTPVVGADTGVIEGAVSVGAVSSLGASGDLQVVPVGTVGSAVGADGALGGAAFVPGELIVGFVSVVRAQSLAPLVVGSVRAEAVRVLALPGVALYRTAVLERAGLEQLARALEARPDVLYAHPNYVLEAQRVPNDPLYVRQWHYSRVGLPAAWDITTGSAVTVVAVVDTGILHSFSDSALTHPDLVGKVVPGYDFVSSPEQSGDGGGRDDDPYEVFPVDHGTHVAGTVAARTDDGVGVAGVDWQARILPVRVLGPEGGSLDDVIDGTLWAAGFDVVGVPANGNPAHVINLSLGAAGGCPMAFQQAFDRIAEDSPRNAVVVVAAGNEDDDASGYGPASCRNAITVGATDYRDHRASYSNYGTVVDVMAPGGDVWADFSGFGNDGVLSLSFGGAPGSFGYAGFEGTSMAAPHVAGVVSLMKALEPALTYGEALEALRASARPLSAAACGRPSGVECGAGLIDAEAALVMVRDGTIPVPGTDVLEFEPSVLDFGASSEILGLTLRNSGAASIDWVIDRAVPADGNSGVMLEGSVLMDPLGGTIGPGATQVVDVAIDRALVTEDGAYAFRLVFDVEGEEVEVSVRFVKGDVGMPALSGPLLVAAFVQGDGGEWVESGFQLEASFFSAYSFTALAGDNLVIAWSDENGNLEIDAGDYIGVYPDLVSLVPDATVAGVDIALERVVTVDEAAWREGLPEGADWTEVRAALAAAASRTR